MRLNFRRGFTTVLALIMLGSVAFAFTQSEEGPKSLEGKAAPNVKLKTLDNKTFDLSQMKGNVVLMDYWATWCPPCRKSLPHLNALANNRDLYGQGLRVVGINSKEDPATVARFMKDNNYTFVTPLDSQGAFGRDYKVRGIPTTVLVDQTGTVAKVWVGYNNNMASEMDTEIKKLLSSSQADE